MEETADEYLASHVTPAHDDDVMGHGDDVTGHDDVTRLDNAMVHDDDVTRYHDDVTGHVSEGDDEEGRSGEHEDAFEDAPKNEDMEIEKRVKWQDSEGNYLSCFE